VGPVPRQSLPLVDLLKALSSQLIVWHHLAFYGPMSDVVYPYAPALISWHYDYARMAVQVFLVLGGFLTARTLAPGMEFDQPARAIGLLLWRRYLRLARPYLVAIAAAIAAAAFARALIQYPSTPTAPTFLQIAAHVFLVQDIIGQEALSAGVWYVAIDFQLYALFLLILWLSRARATAALLACATLASVSLLWLNRQPDLDIYAPYFFGAYGLGIIAQWISNQPRKSAWLAALALLVASALIVEWRTRILVAGVTALMLAATGGVTAPRWSWVSFLSRISYSVFVIHYAVILAVSAVVYRYWPASHSANAAGMAAAWMLSLAAGALLHRYVESPQRA